MLLRAIQQAPAYPRISWCSPGNSFISDFPSIKAEGALRYLSNWRLNDLLSLSFTATLDGTRTVVCSE
ncbi:hypothetical protein Tco_1490953, partial [Tanacetum coccineum]